MARRSKDIGTDAERLVVRHLIPNGWPSAERRALHGTKDLGDITGTPGIVWEVKGGEAAKKASDNQIIDWLVETEIERANANADVGVLVVQRSRKNVRDWWAVMHSPHFVQVAELGVGRWSLSAPDVPVRLLLQDMIRMLHWAGYGTPNEEE